MEKQDAKEKRKEKLQNAYEKGKIIEVKVKDCDKNLNLIVDLGDGVEGIIYRDETTLTQDEDGFVSEVSVMSKMHKRIRVKIIDIDEGRYILSKKEVELEARKWMQENLKPGMVVFGRVRSIQHYGVFVEILDGVVGLLHIEDISIARIRNPQERFTIGDKIKVAIKDYDKDTGKIVLTHKELLGTWEENVAKFQEGTEVKGIAREREKNGIFVELTPNLVGLAEHRPGIEYGQEVTVYIKKIVPDKKKIKLVIVG